MPIRNPTGGWAMQTEPGRLPTTLKMSFNQILPQVLSLLRLYHMSLSFNMSQLSFAKPFKAIAKLGHFLVR